MPTAQKQRFPIRRQPDDITCGPTCLHAIYQYYGDKASLTQVIKETPMLKGGGTLGALLGTHALKRGYKVCLYSYNLKIFDPTWNELPSEALRSKLKAQLKVKQTPKFKVASQAYLDFLKAGGLVRLHDMTSALITEYLVRGIPLLAGLSSTWLYKTMREYGRTCQPDDIRGRPAGHFVVLTSYDEDGDVVTVADPYHPDSMDSGHYYKIGMEHLLCAIMLGVMTYDGNLIAIVRD